MILRVFIVLLGVTGLICAVLCYTEAHDYFDKFTAVLALCACILALTYAAIGV